MSLEDAINNHAAAVRELAAAMSGKAAPAAAPKAEAKKPSATSAPAAATTAAAPASAPVDGSAPEFSKIVDAFVAMVKAKGPESADKLLAHFGQDAKAGGKLSKIDKSRHAELMAEIVARSA